MNNKVTVKSLGVSGEGDTNQDSEREADAKYEQPGLNGEDKAMVECVGDVGGPIWVHVRKYQCLQG